MSILGKEVIGRFIDVTRYPHLSSSIPDRQLEIIEVIESKETSEIRSRYEQFLGGISAAPAAVTLGDEMIFIGDSTNNEGCVYYVDIEFGVFKLHESMEEFLNAIKP
ncbi:hypothetical protein [Halomonas sp. N3-2A]|uniref:hypothetical protein n=1 Tax=Halomonas sp. N3-2A TaxID=2014541 RepID=UPI000B5B38B5|nr:hypothetical protein [Halomonas sp. N3-2A]ASK18605.1 hypothetical protein CEK60_04465 [Halomonas sp. N3-2A]